MGRLAGPLDPGVAVEPTGALVVADADLGAVVRVDAATGDRAILSGGPSGRGPRLTAASRVRPAKLRVRS